MTRFFQLLIAIGLTGLLFSCNDSGTDDPQPGLVIPAAYDSSNFVSHTSEQTAFLARFKTLVDTIKKGRTGSAFTFGLLNSLFQTGDPSVSSVSTEYYRNQILGENGYLMDLVRAGGNTYTPGPPSGNGGTFGGYLFDRNGVEPEQLIEKGLFGAGLFHTLNLYFEKSQTLAVVNQEMAIVGLNPTFPNTSSTKAPKPDVFFAVYMARRDKNDGQGFYTLIKNDFLKLQAAAKWGDTYSKEKAEAIAGIRSNMEKVNAATIINYCHSVQSTMSKTNPTEADKGAALHALGECIGFAHGYRQLPVRFRKITDAQIDSVLSQLYYPINGTPEPWKFITAPAENLNRLSTVITSLKGIYGFTDAQIEDFKKNWVVEQNR